MKEVDILDFVPISIGSVWALVQSEDWRVELGRGAATAAASANDHRAALGGLADHPLHIPLTPPTRCAEMLGGTGAGLLCTGRCRRLWCLLFL